MPSCRTSVLLVVVVCVSLLCVCASASALSRSQEEKVLAALELDPPVPDPSYDHQTKTYTSVVQPKRFQDVSVTITPFFSPDHSISTLTNLVQSATQSVDIMAPGFSSWSGCTPFSGCYNCTVEQVLKTESFPIFQSLLNKVHSGVKVRILTNDYGFNLCPGRIGPLGYLKLAGADVRFFTTLTFMHNKYINVDQKKSSVSSVNFSFTSFMKNREAGMIFEGNSDIIAYYNSVFESDFASANPYTPSQTYTPAEMAMIHDPTPIPVVIPEPLVLACNTKSPLQPISGTTTLTTFVSPDFALNFVLSGMNQTSKTFDISIYQINNDVLCENLVSLKQRGVAVRVFVSYRIVSNDDWKTSQQCYQKLTDAGLTVMQAQHNCVQYSHQKYWIMDGETVGMSSGNWAPTDFPVQQVFPPYSQPGWTACNRDMNVAVTDPSVVSTFQQVFDEDYNQGQKWHTY